MELYAIDDCEERVAMELIKRAKDFKIESPDLDLELQETPMTWKEIETFLDQEGFSHSALSQLTGHYTARETISRQIHSGGDVSKQTKFSILCGLKYRSHLLMPCERPECFGLTECSHTLPRRRHNMGH